MSATPVDLKRCIELILEQLDQLPTLSAVALRLLEVTSSDDSDADDVIELVSADPSLSARLLQLCRRSHLGVSLEEADVAHAVKLLGFDEVRAAAAAVQVFELLDGLASRGGEVHGQGPLLFDPAAFWQHSIAVATLAERLARTSPLRRIVKPGDAFLGGLMHDLGQLALHTILPRSFDRACEVAETHGCGIDECCQRIIGVDSHSVGRHLAQHWQLPARLIEVIWLSGETLEASATATNPDLVRVVALADLLARRQLLAHAGHTARSGDVAQFAAALRLDPVTVDAACDRIHEEVEGRAASLGMGKAADVDVVRQSIERAAHLVERVQARHARQRAAGHATSRILRAAAALFESGGPGGSLTSAIAAVAKSAMTIFESPPCAILYMPGNSTPAELFQFDDSGAHTGTTRIAVPENTEPHSPPGFALVRQVMPWLADSLAEPPGPDARLLGLTCSDDVSAYVILRDGRRSGEMNDASRTLFSRMWGSAVSSAAFHARLDDMGERLIASNRQLVAAQESLTRQRAAHAVAQFAFGAAHEMNNPLTVISGRAQSLARKLNEPGLRDSASEIVRQAHTLSDLITSLRLAAEAPDPAPQVVSMIDVVNDAVRLLRQRNIEGGPVCISIEESMPPARFDRGQVAQALRELLQNAQEADPRGEIVVRVHIDSQSGRLIISVTDAGPGLTPRALEHAFDPFFSEKPAGRQPGLGLARARRLVEANHGQLTLKNREGGGAVATILLAEWRADADASAALQAA